MELAGNFGRERFIVQNDFYPSWLLFSSEPSSFVLRSQKFVYRVPVYAILPNPQVRIRTAGILWKFFVVLPKTRKYEKDKISTATVEILGKKYVKISPSISLAKKSMKKN